MSGEPGWNVDPATRGVLLLIESMGYVVSVYRLPSSLLGRVGPSMQLHAVKLGDPPETHVGKLANTDSEDDVYAGACELARMVGVELDD